MRLGPSSSSSGLLLDLDTIRRDYPLPSVAGASVKLRPAGRELIGCCPFHADRSPSFTIFGGGQRFHCFGCGESGDVIDFVRKAHGVGLREAADMLTGGNLPVVAVPAPPERPERDTQAEALAIWRNASSIRDTPAQTYLAGRGITTRLPESLRFARLKYGARGREYPCLVALVASVDNKATGIQRTYLTEHGRKADVPKVKLSLGNVLGGAIRLAPAAAVLTVCEGLEDGLSLQQETGMACWVAAGASMLPGMRLPVGCNDVIIGADTDETGEREAQKAATAFTEQGRRVRIIRPLDGCKDFNEELQKGAA